MEISTKEISKDLIYQELKSLFLEKGYPERFLFWDLNYPFSYEGLNFEVNLDLLVKEEAPLLILKYHPSKGGLASFERPLLAFARLIFQPLPSLAVLTNLEHFILIEVKPRLFSRGGRELLPDFESLKKYQASFERPFNPEVERKILAFYLSGG